MEWTKKKFFVAFKMLGFGKRYENACSLLKHCGLKKHDVSWIPKHIFLDSLIINGTTIDNPLFFYVFPCVSNDGIFITTFWLALIKK
jgi:hypothetical protein